MSTNNWSSYRSPDLLDLASLLDSDPALVVEAVGRILDATDTLVTDRYGAAGLMVDGGALLRDLNAVERGLAEFRNLASEVDDEDVSYNLANGLLAATDLLLEAGRADDAREYQAEARTLLHRAGNDETADPDNRAKALTNLGNCLSVAGRYVEAYDAYNDALVLRPDFAMAQLNAAVILERAIDSGNGGAGAATRLMELLQASSSQRTELHTVGGALATETLDRLQKRCATHNENIGAHVVRSESFLRRLTTQSRGAVRTLRRWRPGRIDRETVEDKRQDERRWIAGNHLALVRGLENYREELLRADNLRIGSFAEPIDAPFAPPVVFSAHNSLKQSYLLARELVFRAVDAPLDQGGGQYADTLDYALWGPTSARLIAGQRIALDLLDQVAVGVNDLIDIGADPTKVHFHSFFSKKEVLAALEGGTPQVRQQLEALRSMAADVQKDFALYEQRLVRNAGTHRFIVLHDMMIPDGFRDSRAIDHFEIDHFEEMAIRALQVARAALVHFTALAEAVGASTGPGVKQSLPPHHQIRGYGNPV